MDMTSTVADVHMRTDANNLVTTASTTHLPEQRETIHMINQLRHESCSGAIQDLAHVTTAEQMADLFTKEKAPSEPLKRAVDTGYLPNCDKHLPFREMMRNKHKAFFIKWLVHNLDYDVVLQARTFLCFPVMADIQLYLNGGSLFEQ